MPIRLVVCSGAERGVEGAHCIFCSVYSDRVAVYKMEIVATSSDRVIVWALLLKFYSSYNIYIIVNILKY